MALIRGSQISGSVASASYAVTASYAVNGNSFPYSGSAVITGSLVVTGGITGSMNITNLSSGSYTQSFTDQSTWTVQHNLNSAYVVVQTYDSREEQMLPQTIDLTDANTTTITFPVALSGTAVVVVGTPLAGNGGGGNTSVSASYATNASLLDGMDSSIFATTGSNAFKADQQVTGSLFVSGGLYMNGIRQFNHGAFSDTTSQSGSANTAYAIKFNTVDINGHGVSVVSGSRLTVNQSGTYNLQFSAQLDRVASSGVGIVSIWLQANGSDVANSCTDVVLLGNANTSAVAASWNFVFVLSAGQYCELMWSTTDANLQITAVPTRTAPARPAVPSVIATLTQVG